MLTDTKLRNIKPKDKLYKVNDRDGLYVAITPVIPPFLTVAKSGVRRPRQADRTDAC